MQPTRFIGETERRAAEAEARRKAEEFERKFGHLRVAEEATDPPASQSPPARKRFDQAPPAILPPTSQRPAVPEPPKRPKPPQAESLPAKIMAAARTLGAEPFTQNALVMAAWEMFHDDFSLVGFIHPDNHKVICCLCGDKGLVARGFLRRVGKGLLEVSR
jgi:hypothetical protein